MGNISVLRELLLLGAFLFMTAFSMAVKAQEELVVLTWEDYLDPALVSAFEQRHQVSLRLVYYGDDDERDVMMSHSNGEGYDLILIDEASVETYVDYQWIRSLDSLSATQQTHFIVDFMPNVKDWQKYAVPYFWGTLGILYRDDLIADAPTSWQDLFVPHASIQGKILMLDTAKVLLGTALKAQGYDLNNTSAEALTRAEQLLIAQKPYVKAYRNFRLDKQSLMISGEVVAAMAYNGDALALMEHHPELRFVLPTEGSSLWVDFFAVSAASRQPDLAFKFLEFISEPEMAAKNAQYLKFASPNKLAEPLLSDNFLSNPSIYPPKEFLNQSEPYRRWPPRVMKRATNLYMQLSRPLALSVQ